MTERNTSRLVDFHCHLDLYPDHAAAVLHRAREGVFTLAVTTTPKAFPRNKELADRTKHVRAALGLHPQLVAKRSHELALWKEYLPSTRYVGEVGLDAGRQFYRSFDDQKAIFAEVLASCAEARNKILSVHSVRCAKVVLDMIESKLPLSAGRVVMHWFTGTPADARRAAAIGCYFSVNSAMLQTDKAKKLVQSLPRDRILTETDGPFTDRASTPQMPPDLTPTRDALATALGFSPEETSDLVSKNLKVLLS